MVKSVQQSLRKAQIYLKNGELSKAEIVYKQILEKFPKNKNAILGYQKLVLGNRDGVLHSSEGIQEHFKELIHLYNLENFELVLSKINKIIGLFPNAYELFNLQGVCNAALQRHSSAIDSYKQAIKIKPNYPEVYYNMGVSQQNQSDLAGAIDSYKHAIQIKPNYAGAYYNIGTALRDQGDLAAAIDSYKQAIQIKPDYADAYYNMGISFKEHGDLAAAIDSYKRAIKIKPDYTDAYYNMGNAQSEQGDLAEAIDSYKQALKIMPDYQIACAAKLYRQAHICDWVGIENDKKQIPELGTSTQRVSPFDLLALEDSPSRQRLRAEIYTKNGNSQSQLPIAFKPVQKPTRLRIGYFSSDFCEHPVSYLIAQMLELHDREHFEVYAYSFYPGKIDKMYEHIENVVDVFHDVRKLNDKDIALLAQQDRIDIAIDLNGHTKNARSGIFAYRAAPIQINYLGYPGTMSAEFIDYIIADRVIIPKEYEQHYQEHIIRLPNSYMVTDNTRQISTRNITRVEMGLPEKGFVFCCFNNNYKISIAEFNIWMRLLLKVPDSVLWLRKSNRWSDENFRKEAKKRGVDSSRLVFADRVLMDDHLARHKLADLFIDTFVFNAHTTATEALWAGVPVVTKLGKGFAARVAGSLLNAIGLPELITETVEDYESLILELATNPQSLGLLKEKLATNRLSAPLFDTELFTKHLEDGYEQAYQQYFEKKEPKAIYVSN